MAFGTASLAQVPAQNLPGQARAHHGQMMRHMMEKLNLSKGQMDQIKGIREQSKARMKSIRASSTNLDQKQIEAKEVRAHSREKILSVLTPAQRSKFMAMRAEMKAKHGGIKINK